MSKVIDERVVAMQFDNRHFEQNVKTSMSTLDKLKNALNFTGASKGLENLNTSVSKVDMSTLGRGIEAVHTKFSALQVMGVTALANITNSAVNAGKRISSALTVEPLKAGFSEYETKINSIQTIMSNTASKGTTMKDVTRVIDDLNTYADKTIYNFAEMTRNIGTFTAAGVGLEESASAIKGIANLAAASGSSSQQASTAMYQLSQALSTGTVRLMDWNSVVNAGMGGEKFQEALKATAREHGVAIDSIIKKSGSFRDSLQEEWLSAEILNETLNKFTVDGAKKYADSMMKSGKWTQEQADALMKEAQSMEDAATKVKTFTQLVDTLKESLQSGWGKTWEILVGDFEEAKSLFTEISDTLGGVIGKSADSRNELLQSWKDMGGRELLIDALRNSFEALTRIVKPIKEAFREVFPPTTAEQLLKLSEGIKNLTEKFKISSDTADKLKQTFKGIFSFFAILINAIKSVVKGFVDLIKNFSGIEGGLLDITAAIGNWITRLKDAITDGNIFGKAIDKIVGVLSSAITKIKEFGSSVKESVNTSWVDALVSALQKAWDNIQSIADRIRNVVSGIGSNFVEVLGNPNLGSILTSGALTGVFIAIQNLVRSTSGTFKGIKDSFKGIAETLDEFRGCIQAYQTSIKANALKNIAIAIAILAASLLVLSMINPDRLGKAVAAMGIMFGELVASLGILNKLSLDTKGFVKATTMMIGMSIAILILSSAMKKIASLDWNGVAKGIVGIGALMAELSIFLRTFEGAKRFKSNAIGIVILSSAMLILANAMAKFGAMSWETIAKGLVSIGALLAEIGIFMKLVGDGKRFVSAGISMVLIGAAMKILANAMYDFGNMNLKSIGKALLAMGGALAELVIALRLMPKNVISIGLGLVILGAAMKILADAVTDFGDMDLKSIGKALLAMGGALAELVIALRLMPKNVISIGLGLVVVGAALKILADAMTDFGGMSWSEIARGLVLMGGALAELVIALHLMRGTISGSLALVVAAGALGMMAPVIKTLGNMSWGSIARSLVALAGAFTVIGLAALLLKPVVPTILAFSGAIALLGVGVAAIGAGMILAGIGLGALATGLVALVSGISASASSVVTAIKIIVTGFAEMIPIVLENLGEGIVQLIKIIGDYAPDIAGSLLKLVFGCLSEMVTYIPQIIEQVAKLILGVIEGLTIYLPEMIVAAVNLIGALLQGVVQAINGLDTENLLKGILSLGILSVLAYILSGVASLIPGAMLGVLGLGALVVELGLVLAAIGALKQIPGLSWLIDEGGEFLESIGTAIGKFFGGLAGGVLGGVSSAFPQIGSDLSDFMNNAKDFINGAKELDASMLEGTKAHCEVIMMLTAANVLDSITSWITGGNTLSQFGEQLKPFGEGMKAYGDAVSGIDANTVTASATAAKSIAELANNLPNSGGVAGWFAGENDLDTFGEMLTTFGEGMKSYSDAIVGMDPEAVTASATAALSIAELANKLPNTGGVSGWFAGENDIDTFGTKLEAFAKGMKAYSDAIYGIDPTTITASATAAMSLAELANNLPNSGGVVSWFTGDNNIDEFGSMLATFGKGMKAYSDEVADIDPKAVSASTTAAKSLAELANNLPNTGGIVSWFTGDNDLDTFGSKLKTFGEGMKAYGDEVADIDSKAVTASATAAKSLAELANNLPNSGGVISWFTGENDLDTFGEMLVVFGKGMKSYGDAIEGIDSKTISESTTAAKSIAELADNLPNSGGVISWFTGDNDLDTFGKMLTAFGKGMKGYSDEIKGIDTDAVTASATAAKSLAELAAVLPNTGGLVSWFTGENDIDDFGDMLIVFGEGMKGYADEIKGVDADAVTASANAASTLAELANTLPNTGGLVSWFTGDNTLDAFGEMLTAFGEGMKSYSDSVDGMNTEAVTTSIDAVASLVEIGKLYSDNGGAFDWLVTDMSELKPQLVLLGEAMKGYANAVKGIDTEAIKTSTTAAGAIVELANSLYGTGGVKQKLTGEKDLASFAEDIVPLGTSIKKYSDAVTGIDADSVTASANAAKTLGELSNNLPSPGLFSSWFGAESSLITFGEQLPTFGSYIRQYWQRIQGIDPEVVSASATAAKSLAELVNNLPSSCTSIFSIFTADNPIETFGSQIVSFGKYMKLYGMAVSGIDTTLITNSATAGKALCELVNTLPGSSLSIFNIFGESESIDSFGGKLVAFGKYMKSYGVAVSGIDTTLITNSATAGKALCELANSLGSTTSIFSIFTGVDSVDSFGGKLVSLAEYIKKYSNAVQGFNYGNIDKSISTAKKLIGLIKDMVGLSSGGATSFKNAINALAESKISDFINAFNVQEANIAKLGENIVNMLINGIESKSSLIRDTSKDIVSNMVSQLSDSSKNFRITATTLMKSFIDGINNSVVYVRIAIITPITSMISVLTGYYSSFYSAGSYLVSGFANGISDNAYKAAAKTRAMAKAAKQAAEEALGIASPSKVFYGIGRFTALGFTNAINDNIGGVYNSTSEMAEAARSGISNAIGKISDIINSDIDAEPTIRPVLDLSDVESGSRLINGMFNNRLAIGATTDVGSISSMMNSTIQNGGNDDVISAIDKLRDSLGNIGGNTYNVNGVTYDDGSNVSNAVKSLVRAARIERRV